MPSVCFYLHTHQPCRLRPFSIFDIGRGDSYFDFKSNQQYLARIVQKSYLPTNQILLDLVKKTRGRFRMALSITGVLLEQLENNFPEALASFQALAKTGCLEILAETHHHSLAFLYSKEEFKEQVALHSRKIKKLFGIKPKVFRNTELMFSNQMAQEIKKMGFQTVLAEGADYILGWRSPNFVYQVKGSPGLRVLLRNYRLSDDISFRFSSREWLEWPLTAEKFAGWVSQANGQGQVVNLFMDYETFGEHQWAETGIFDFLKALPFKILEHSDNNFKTPSEVVQLYQAVGELDFNNIVTWADTERDLSAWLGNQMQQAALRGLYSLEQAVKNNGQPELLEDWRKLQTSDHFYYMCTKWFADGDVHKYFNPYQSPYEAFIIFMNIFNDLKLKLKSSEISLQARAKNPAVF